MPGRVAPEFMRSTASNAYYLGVVCRGCSGISCATIRALNTQNVSIETVLYRGNSSVDITANVSDLIAQGPKLQNDVSEHIPECVREAIWDAYDSVRPRARCASFRTAVEFALRETGINAPSGKTLGAILKDAEKSYALPPALIELCDQVKAFGTWGLHWSETAVEAEDADAAQEITEAIMNDLFELPALVQAAKVRTEEAKTAHHSK